MILKNETTHIPTTPIVGMAHLCFVEMISSPKVSKNDQITVILIMITMATGPLYSVEVDLFTNQEEYLTLSGENNTVLMVRCSILA